MRQSLLDVWLKQIVTNVIPTRITSNRLNVYQNILDFKGSIKLITITNMIIIIIKYKLQVFEHNINLSS